MSSEITGILSAKNVLFIPVELMIYIQIMISRPLASAENQQTNQ